jgi:hypothetical protein
MASRVSILENPWRLFGTDLSCTIDHGVGDDPGLTQRGSKGQPREYVPVSTIFLCNL